MALLINETGILYGVIEGWSVNVTGDLWITFYFLLIFLLLIGLIFKLPLDLIFIITLPFTFIISAYTGSFSGVLAFYIMYLVLWLYRIFRALTSGY